MTIEVKYLVDPSGKYYMASAIRKIEAGKRSLSSLIELDEYEMETYRRAIPIAVDVPEKREEFVPQNHQEILKGFGDNCFRFINYMIGYNGKNYDPRQDTVIEMTRVVMDYTDRIIKHLPFPDKEQEN